MAGPTSSAPLWKEHARSVEEGTGDPPDISLVQNTPDEADGTISGTGFTPNSSVTLTRVYSPSGEEFSGVVSTDATGAFVDSGYNFCFPVSTSVEVTATDEAGVSVTESFPLSC